MKHTSAATRRVVAEVCFIQLKVSFAAAARKGGAGVDSK
jgi:hypothetical protein